MKKIYLVILSIVAFIIIAYFGFLLNEQYVSPNQCPVILNRSERFMSIPNETIPNHRFFQEGPQLPAIGILGIIIISLIPLVVLYSNLKVEKKLSESIEILSKFSERKKTKKITTKLTLGKELIARLLEPNEIMVVERLLKETKIQQKEIANLPGMNKLKAHRLVERLKEKGIVNVQKEGKTKLIKLNPRFKNLMMELE